MATYVFYFEKPSFFNRQPLRLIYADDRQRNGKTNEMRNAIREIRNNPYAPRDKRIKKLPNEWYHKGDKTVVSFVYTFTY